MTRRRLVLIAVAAAALGAAWWWFATGLSAEERRLVGSWRHDVRNDVWPSGLTVVWDLGQDRTCRVRYVDPATGAYHQTSDGSPRELRGRWRVDERRLYFVWGNDPVSRLRRLLPEGFPGSQPVAEETCPIDSTTDAEMVLRSFNGKVISLRRVSAD
jgi:hypothetical protein